MGEEQSLHTGVGLYSDIKGSGYSLAQATFYPRGEEIPCGMQWTILRIIIFQNYYFWALLVLFIFSQEFGITQC